MSYPIYVNILWYVHVLLYLYHLPCITVKEFEELCKNKVNGYDV